MYRTSYVHLGIIMSQYLDLVHVLVVFYTSFNNFLKNMVSANYTPGDYIFSPQKFGVSTLGYLINLGQGPPPPTHPQGTPTDMFHGLGILPPPLPQLWVALLVGVKVVFLIGPFFLSAKSLRP